MSGNDDTSLQLPSLTSLNSSNSASSMPPPPVSFSAPTSNFDLNALYGQFSQANTPANIMYNAQAYPPFTNQPSANSGSAVASTSAATSFPRDSQSPNLTASPRIGQASTSAPTAASGSKKTAKKRKSAAAGTEDDDEDGEDGKKKRIKTPRACDSCRRKKIRYVALQMSKLAAREGKSGGGASIFAEPLLFWISYRGCRNVLECSVAPRWLSRCTGWVPACSRTKGRLLTRLSSSLATGATL